MLCYALSMLAVKDIVKKDAVSAAKLLLGCRLIHETPEGTVSGIIIETEAYHQDDPASHSYRGQTKRTEVMFGEPGHAYVYFTYGLHYCLNVVTGPKGRGEAVLIRALEPIEGIKLMKKRRSTNHIGNLCSGPAKLTQAMAINLKHNGQNIIDGSLRIEPGIKPGTIISTARVGISSATNKPWRFYIDDNKFVSKL